MDIRDVARQAADDADYRYTFTLTSAERARGNRAQFVADAVAVAVLREVEKLADETGWLRERQVAQLLAEFAPSVAPQTEGAPRSPARTLKDYRPQHDSDCQMRKAIDLSRPCTCGLSALLTAVQQPRETPEPATPPSYDFDMEARIVCAAIGSEIGWMTVNCALHEAHEAGRLSALPPKGETDV